MDSEYIPSSKIFREKESKVGKRSEFDEAKANRGKNYIVNGYYLGNKIYPITTFQGVYKDKVITPVSTYDIHFQNGYPQNVAISGIKKYLWIGNTLTKVYR